MRKASTMGQSTSDSEAQRPLNQHEVLTFTLHVDRHWTPIVGNRVYVPIVARARESRVRSKGHGLKYMSVWFVVNVTSR